MPAVVDGEIHKWYKNGKIHREGDIPPFMVVDKYGI